MIYIFLSQYFPLGIALSNRLSTGSITSDFKKLFSIGNKNAIVEYNVESMSSTVIERQRGEQVECTNDLVFVACSGSIQVLDSNRKIIQEISCHSGKISHMKRHKSLLVTSSSDGSICIFVIKDLNVPESHFSVDECLISVSFLNEKENQSRLLHHKVCSILPAHIIYKSHFDVIRSNKFDLKRTLIYVISKLRLKILCVIKTKFANQNLTCRNVPVKN